MFVPLSFKKWLVRLPIESHLHRVLYILDSMGCTYKLNMEIYLYAVCNSKDHILTRCHDIRNCAYSLLLRKFCVKKLSR